MDISRPSPTTAPRDSQDGPLPLPGGERGEGCAPLVTRPTPEPQIGAGLRTIYVRGLKVLDDGWFFARVEKTPTCWLWRGPRKGFGYGSGPGGEYAHRWAYRTFIGPIPPGKYVLHRCDTPLCVKPDHLFLGTQHDNLKDAAAKGRMIRGSAHYNAKLTEEDVRRIRSLREAGTPATGLCQQYGISFLTVWRILHRKTWAWLT